MIDRKALIDALKCSIKAPREKCRDDCPYLLRNETVGNGPSTTYIVIYNCDTVRMARESIEMLEGTE